MAWHQVSVITNEEIAPALADYFSSLGAISVTFMDAEDEPVYEPAVGETKIWTNTRVTALYELASDPAMIKSSVFHHFHAAPLLRWEFEEIADQDWERVWLDEYRPMKFADRLWVCPSGFERHEADTVCLTLDPGLAFGTGTHPTTALCLEWLASQDMAGKTVIDYGCGSGILAIAALLLGAKTAHAVDIDPQALTATHDNAVKNRVQDNLSCHFPETFEVANVQADVVLANILAKPLMDMADWLTDLVVSGGKLVLSGILAEQAQAVVASYRPYLALDNFTQKEDWVRLTGTKG